MNLCVYKIACLYVRKRFGGVFLWLVLFVCFSFFGVACAGGPSFLLTFSKSSNSELLQTGDQCKPVFDISVLFLYFTRLAEHAFTDTGMVHPLECMTHVFWKCRCCPNNIAQRQVSFRGKHTCVKGVGGYSMKGNSEIWYLVEGLERPLSC